MISNFVLSETRFNPPSLRVHLATQNMPASALGVGTRLNTTHTELRKRRQQKDYYFY